MHDLLFIAKSTLANPLQVGDDRNSLPLLRVGDEAYPAEIIVAVGHMPDEIAQGLDPQKVVLLRFPYADPFQNRDWLFQNVGLRLRLCLPRTAFRRAQRRRRGLCADPVDVRQGRVPFGQLIQQIEQ